MIKKWTVCLSIIILVLNFVPNLLQGHQVFAENQKNYKDKVELINDESFNISYLSLIHISSRFYDGYKVTSKKQR